MQVPVPVEHVAFPQDVGERTAHVRHFQDLLKLGDGGQNALSLRPTLTDVLYETLANPVLEAI